MTDKLSHAFVFIEIAGCTFKFENRRLDSGARRWNPVLEAESSHLNCAETSAFPRGKFSLPFVFIEIAGCTFIFKSRSWKLEAAN